MNRVSDRIRIDRRAAAAGLAAALGTLGLVGCGSSAGSGSATTPPAATTTAGSAAGNTTGTSTGSPATATATAPVVSTATTAPPPAAATAKLTAPGTRLKPGQSAIVAYDTTLANGNDGPSYKLQITVESITAGSMSDFKGISLSGVPKGSSPTYVRVRMTNLGKPMNTSSNDPADGIQAIEHNGQMDSNLILTGYFPPCPDADTPNPFASGQTFTTCETYMERGEATQIGYNGSDATLDSPIIWSP